MPRLADLLVEPPLAAEVEQKFLAFRSGLLLIGGSSSMAANVFVYALLRSMSEAQQRLIFILETGITFLLRHNRSVVLQCELGSDVDSVDQGLRTALTLNPNVIYVRDIANPKDLATVVKAVDSQVFTVVTVSVLDAELLLPGGPESLDQRSLRGVWHVDRAESDRLRVLME